MAHAWKVLWVVVFCVRILANINQHSSKRLSLGAMAIVIKLEGNNPQEEQKSNSKHHERLSQRAQRRTPFTSSQRKNEEVFADTPVTLP
jgi:hypothetical protein